MKKLLAIILSAICIFSCIAVPASAAGAGILGEIGTSFFEKIFGAELEEDTPLVYGVTYANDTLSGVKIIYKPNADNSFENPGLYTVTSDTPLSIDHKFVCWEDSKGNRYYAGDKIYVDGNITLYAVWTEKTDNDVSIVRTLKTTIEAFKRLIGTFLGFFKYVVEFDENYVSTNPEDPRYYDITVKEAVYEDAEEGKERILFYLDSLIFYDFNLKRIESSEPLTADIYFCTGWHEATREPLNKKELQCGYSFSKMQGADYSDVVIIDGTSLFEVIEKDVETEAGTEKVEERVFAYDKYLSDLEAELNKEIENEAEKIHYDTYYMIVTINDSLYSSEATDTKVYPEYTHPVTCVFTFNR